MVFLDNTSNLSWADNANIVVPVLSDRRKHWSENRLSFVYVYNVDLRKEAVIGIHHNDCSNVSESFLTDFIGTDNYIYHKKYTPAHRSNFEAELVYWFDTGNRFVPNIPAAIKNYYSTMSGVDNINDCIPIMKWLDYCRDIKDSMIVKINSFQVTAPFRHYNNLISELIEVERNGIGNEYSEYNIFTATGRPSNSFNNVNYAALNKTDGSRSRFTSRFENGVLVEIDFSGFHLYLIYRILGIEFPKNVYEQLSVHYPPAVNAKEYTFQQIYGGIDMSLRSIQPFKAIHELSIDFQNRYENDTLTTLIFKKPFQKKIYGDMSRTKIFNYMLQNAETEFNSLVLKKFNDLLTSYKSKLILYTYDSFLFDYNPDDTMELFKKIRSEISVPFHIGVGANYHELKRVS